MKNVLLIIDNCKNKVFLKSFKVAVQSVVPRPAASISPGNLLEMQITEIHLGPAI